MLTDTPRTVSLLGLRVLTGAGLRHPDGRKVPEREGVVEMDTGPDLIVRFNDMTAAALRRTEIMVLDADVYGRRIARAALDGAAPERPASDRHAAFDDDGVR